MIAEAVHELGMAEITVRAVADHLGVSVAGLYHHIDGKQDLLALGAEHVTRSRRPPTDEDQHWAVWLRGWAEHNRRAFTDQPGLIDSYLDGGIGAELFAQHFELALALLVRQGFSVLEAFRAYDAVSTCAVGMALGQNREASLVGQGTSTAAEFEDILERNGDDALPHLRALLDARALPEDDNSFDDTLSIVLRGIAARRGEAWAPIAQVLADSPLR